MLINISEKKLLNKNGLVILHIHINENELHLQNFEIVEEKKCENNDIEESSMEALD